MLSGDLNKQIQLLVDHLRKQPDQNMSLTDIAGITEVLIATMTAYFKSIDTAIYRECRALSEYIENARLEIASLEPDDQENARIPRAGQELDAIVTHTEEATNTIMEAAEEIMALDPSDPDAFTATTQDAVMRIFEACSFQDITGQRISKVVRTLEHIETRVLELRGLMGITEAEMKTAHEARRGDTEDAPKARADAHLLKGPALEGEGIGQSDVDALMGGGFDEADTAEPEPDLSAEPAPVPAQEPVPEPVSEAAAEPASPAKAAKPAPKPKPAAKAKPTKPAAKAKPAPPPPPKPVDPRELDAMFDEDFDPAAEVEKSKGTKQKPEKSPPDSDPDSGGEISQDDIDALFG